MSRYLLIRLVLFGMLAVLCALVVTDEMFLLAGLLGIGAVFTGGQLLDRKGTKRRALRRLAQTIPDTEQTKAAALSARRVR